MSAPWEARAAHRGDQNGPRRGPHLYRLSRQAYRKVPLDQLRIRSSQRRLLSKEDPRVEVGGKRRVEHSNLVLADQIAVSRDALYEHLADVVKVDPGVGRGPLHQRLCTLLRNHRPETRNWSRKCVMASEAVHPCRGLGLPVQRTPRD